MGDEARDPSLASWAQTGPPKVDVPFGCQRPFWHWLSATEHSCCAATEERSSSPAVWGTVRSSALSTPTFFADKKSYVHFRGLDPAPPPALRGPVADATTTLALSAEMVQEWSSWSETV